MTGTEDWGELDKEASTYSFQLHLSRTGMCSIFQLIKLFSFPYFTYCHQNLLVWWCKTWVIFDSFSCLSSSFNWTASVFCFFFCYCVPMLALESISYISSCHYIFQAFTAPSLNFYINFITDLFPLIYSMYYWQVKHNYDRVIPIIYWNQVIQSSLPYVFLNLHVYIHTHTNAQTSPFPPPKTLFKLWSSIFLNPG